MFGSLLFGSLVFGSLVFGSLVFGSLVFGSSVLIASAPSFTHPPGKGHSPAREGQVMLSWWCSCGRTSAEDIFGALCLSTLGLSTLGPLRQPIQRFQCLIFWITKSKYYPSKGYNQ